MKIEFQRLIRNNFLILFTLINLLCVIFGYILLVSIDRIDLVTFEAMFESVYTVYTQFGELLFSALILMQFYVDYKDKNIMFYKVMGTESTRYYLNKLICIILVTCIGTILTSLLVTLPYGRIDMIPVVFCKIEMVMIYYCAIMTLLGFLIKNFVVAFFLNLFLWILGIVVASINSSLRFFAYYDASTKDYSRLLELIDGGKPATTYFKELIVGNIIFDTFVIAACIAVACVCFKRWIKNGI